MRHRIGIMFLLPLSTWYAAGCGHTTSSKVGLISFGDLEGRSIPAHVNGPVVQGISGGYTYSLGDATRDALKGTEFDTLVDVDVTTETGLFVPSNRIIVKGTALNSTKLPKSK